MMDTNRIDDLTPEEPNLFYLVLSNACYIPATFCISAARFAAVPVDGGTPEQAVRQEEDTKRTATLQVKETQLPGDGLSFREIPAAVRSIQSRTQRSMQERRNTIAALPPTQEGAVHWCHEAGDVRGLPLEVKRVSSRQNRAAIDAKYNLRQVLHRSVSHNITSTREPPSSKVTPLLNCDAFFGAPGYLSAAGQEHCAAATEEKRRALLLRGGSGFTVMTSPGAGRLPANSTRCICIEFLTDMPGTFEDTLILELQAHPFGSSVFAESDVAAHSSFRQTLKLQVHFPLHVSSVGNSLLFAPCQPALNVTAEPCPLLSVSSCIVSSRLMDRVSAKVSNASRLPVRKSAIQTAIPLNSVAAAAAGAAGAAGAAAWRSDQQVLYNADIQAQRAVALSGNCGGFSPKTTRVDSGSILSSPILPPVGIFKVFNRSSRDMSMNWRVFDLDAWDKQSREHARAPPEATEPGVATRAAEQTAAAEAALGMELCPELQTQQGTEPATGVAAPTTESCRIPRGGPAQQKTNSEAVSFDIATADYPGTTLGGADGGSVNSPPSGDQAGWQFTASVEGDHAREGKEAIGQQGGDAAADSGEQQGPLVESHGRENERDTPVEEAERDTVDVAKDRGGDTRLNRSVTILVPPNDCAIANVLQNVRASMQASIWVDGIQHDGAELGNAPPVVVSPEQCVVKAKSTQTFRITFDGVQGTADKRRFRLVGTGSHVDRTGSHASVSDPAGLLGPPAGSCGGKSGSSSSSCNDRATWGSVERVPNACSIAASQATRQRRSAHDYQPANEVANLPAGLPEESDDEEEDAWCGNSAHPVSALGGKLRKTVREKHR
ncbi:hypothetical protein TGCOUG_217961 [Toxoplasma gondii COUG]|uniref:Uncharacterized protein n=1 Tax=Toxoplasma gondii COUG TaxID=1074873 RepID=A0A2G8XLZ0_TOXGO|nr:hypothetical protein TGCOUG_217961 [Toxoplasma gondii COUG]